MIAGEMHPGSAQRIPLATFIVHIGDYARQLMEDPEQLLELLLTEHDGTVVQVALGTRRFQAYLAVAEMWLRATDPAAAERYNNDALRWAQVVVVEAGDAVVQPDPPSALVLLPPELYEELRHGLFDGLSRVQENDPTFVKRIVNAQHEDC